MKNTRDNGLAERRTAAADAKTALLNAYRTATTDADPAKAARLAERAGTAAAREERRLERERVKAEQKERAIAEAAELQAAAEAEARAESDAREAAENSRIARVIEDQAARKAERDKRYADRKARQA